MLKARAKTMDLTTIKFNHESGNFWESFGMQLIELEKIDNKIRELLKPNQTKSKVLEIIINAFAEKPKEIQSTL